MWGIGSIVAFAIALVLDLAGVAKGNFNWHALALAGLLLLAVHIVAGTGWPWRRG